MELLGSGRSGGSAASRLIGLVACGLLLVVTTSCQPVPPLTPPPLPFPTGCDVGMIGDSLSVGTGEFLAAALENEDCTLAWTDGKVSRRTDEGVLALQIRNSIEPLPAVLVVGLGTNDRYQQQQFAGHIDTVMGLAAGRPVIWIELAFDPIKANMNGILRAKEQQYGNLTIMSWDEAYWSQPTWRSTDDIHATKLGYAARAEMVAAAAQRVAK